MMGTKERDFHSLPEDISLEDLEPEDNFYRRLQERLDLSFVREMVEDRYAASGRPSIDPEVFFRLQLVMFREGIRSERELMRVVADRLSLRWYVGYDLFEALPDHSSLTRIRDRFGLRVFRWSYATGTGRCRILQANFLELRKGEVRRNHLLRSSVNKPRRGSSEVLMVVVEATPEYPILSNSSRVSPGLYRYL